MTDLFGYKELKALSWKEPFASLMLHGKIETRKWKVSYRGEVLICASLKPYSEAELLDISGDTQERRIMETLTWKAELSKTLGHAIAVGTLVDCRPMLPEDEDACFVKYKDPWLDEKHYKGGYTEIVHKMLYCHIYENIRAIKPLPFKGRQGWTTLNEEFRKQLEYIT